MQKFWSGAQVALWLLAALLAWSKISNGRPLIAAHPFTFESSERSGHSEAWAGR